MFSWFRCSNTEHPVLCSNCTLCRLILWSKSCCHMLQHYGKVYKVFNQHFRYFEMCDNYRTLIYSQSFSLFYPFWYFLIFPSKLCFASPAPPCIQFLFYPSLVPLLIHLLWWYFSFVLCHIHFLFSIGYSYAFIFQKLHYRRYLFYCYCLIWYLITFMLSIQWEKYFYYSIWKFNIGIIDFHIS